jgi:hypothetical protein
VRLLALAAVAAPFALVACGGEAAGDPMAQAATRLEEAGTARLTVIVDGKPVGHGVLDVRSGRAHMTLDTSETEGSEVPSYQMILDGQRFYVEVGALIPKLRGKWLRADDLEAGVLPFQNPRDLIGFLRDEGKDLEEKGSERVRGVETTRYDGTILQSKINGFEGRDDRPNHFSIWVDADGLARRLTLEDRTVKESWTSTIEYHDFGAPVTVALPAAGDVITEEEMQRACDESADDPSSMYCFSDDGVTDYGEIEEVE